MDCYDVRIGGGAWEYPTDTVERAIHLGINLLIGIGGATWLTMTDSPWTVGIALEAIELGHQGGRGSGGVAFALGAGLVGRCVNNLMPSVAGTQVAQSLLRSLGPPAQGVIGASLIAIGVRREYRVLFHSEEVHEEYARCYPLHGWGGPGHRPIWVRGRDVQQVRGPNGPDE